MRSGKLFPPAILLIGLLVPVSAVLGDDEPAANRKPGAEAVSKAVTVESPGFLKVPPGLTAEDFVIAKTPPVVDVCFFDGLKDRGKGTLWSSWGDGCLARSGKYYTSVGDHLGTDANSYVYEYDPVTKVMARVADVLRAIMHMLGLYGHGKIHAGIHEAEDGSLYFTTYWGKHREIEAAFTKGYQGSVLLRYDPKTGRTENLGAIAPKKGLPASHFDPARQLLSFHAVYDGDIAVYDVRARKVKFLGGSDRNAKPHRTFLGSADGRVYFSGQDGYLHYYDPAKNALGATKARLPGGGGVKKGDNTLRAASRPDRKGMPYGMTSSGRLFSFDPRSEAVKDLGPNFGKGDYTAVMALSPDDRFLYFAPGAHGSGARSGAPVVQYEIATGKRKVLAFLQQPLRDKLGYQIGGTYNLQIDPDGARLFFTFNGADVGGGRRQETFGKPAVVVVHVPSSER